MAYKSRKNKRVLSKRSRKRKTSKGKSKRRCGCKRRVHKSRRKVVRRNNRRKSKKVRRRRRRKQKGGAPMGETFTGIKHNVPVAQYAAPISTANHRVPIQRGGSGLRSLAQTLGFGDVGNALTNVMTAPVNISDTLGGKSIPISRNVDPTVQPLKHTDIRMDVPNVVAAHQQGISEASNFST